MDLIFNINSQLDATITNFIDNYDQHNMFRAIISPVFRSTRLCLQLMVQCTVKTYYVINIIKTREQ